MNTEIQLLQAQLKQRNRELKASYKYAEGLEMEIKGHEADVARLTHANCHAGNVLVDRDVAIRNLREGNEKLRTHKKGYENLIEELNARNKEKANTIASYMGAIDLIKDIVA